jgi:RNA-binding protein NOB1
MDNLDKHLGTQSKQESSDPTKPIERKLTVNIVTSDYAMQNVIIQMGIPLLSLDGKKIRRVKRFKLLCRACH